MTSSSGQGDSLLMSTPPVVPELIETIFLTGQPTNNSILVNSRTNQVYVLENAHVALIEGTQLLKEIPLPRYILGGRMALDEKNDRVYVSYGTRTEESIITVIEAGDKVTHIPLPYVDVLLMTIHPKTQDLYVSGMRAIDNKFAYSELIIIRNNKIISRLNIGKILPRCISIDTLNNYIYIGGGGIHPEIEFESIGVIQVIQNNELINTLTMGQNVDDMAVDTETGEVLVVFSANYSREENGPGMRQEDTAILNKGEVVLMQNLGGQENVGANQIVQYPYKGNFFYLLSNKIIVGQRTKDGLVLIDRVDAGNHIKARTPNAFDLESGNVYQVNYPLKQYEHTVSVINGTENIGTIVVGGGPMAIAVNPNNGWVYVGNNRSGSISVLGYPESTPVEEH